MKYHIEFDIEFKTNPHRGLYVALEGIDGSGKTLQVKRLNKYFEQQGRTVITTREPRKETGLIGEINKKILQGDLKISSKAFQYLFSADRVMHHEELVIPALKRGDVVITDRCFWSAVAYGVIDAQDNFDARKAQHIMIAQGLLSHYHQFIRPDFTFYLDIPVSTSEDRVPRRAGKKEIYERKDILKKVLKGYHWLLEEFPDEFIRVDAQKSIAQVTDDMVKHIET